MADAVVSCQLPVPGSAPEDFKVEQREIYCCRCQQVVPTVAERLAQGDSPEQAALSMLSDMEAHAMGLCGLKAES